MIYIIIIPVLEANFTFIQMQIKRLRIPRNFANRVLAYPRNYQCHKCGAIFGKFNDYAQHGSAF